ncbi:RHS repeat-associated core domain-containing protein [Ardenticatena maritima]|uniref:RHS repeat-associated core domain-containing protein n=1 Tax=Ardenticatena maritima TaxID=872965 RepID=UPI00128FAF6A
MPARGNWTDPHNHYTFLGKEWDEHLALYEFGVRLYDPWAGVWLTREPLPGDAWRLRVGPLLCGTGKQQGVEPMQTLTAQKLAHRICALANL